MIMLTAGCCSGTVGVGRNCRELPFKPTAVQRLLLLPPFAGTGTGDLLDAMVKVLPPPISDLEEDSTDNPLSIAIVGRPNVGE